MNLFQIIHLYCSRFAQAIADQTVQFTPGELEITRGENSLAIQFPQNKMFLKWFPETFAGEDEERLKAAFGESAFRAECAKVLIDTLKNSVYLRLIMLSLPNELMQEITDNELVTCHFDWITKKAVFTKLNTETEVDKAVQALVS